MEGRLRSILSVQMDGNVPLLKIPAWGKCVN